MKVLLVEDEPRLSATLSMGLTAEGFVVVSVDTGVEGLREAIETASTPQKPLPLASRPSSE
jgi:two-component system, OmpR family, response regulator